MHIVLGWFISGMVVNLGITLVEFLFHREEFNRLSLWSHLLIDITVSGLITGLAVLLRIPPLF